MTPKPFTLAGIQVAPGQVKNVLVKISEMVTAAPMHIPVTIVHGASQGPAVFVTAAIHGNELSGIEIVRKIRSEIRPEKLAGTLILVAIANPIGFINQTRELPDGRDLNRAFPGSKSGSIASQIANAIFKKIVKKAQYGIDLHTAGHGRTNLPHVRADMRNPAVKKMARAFGTEIIFDMSGDKGMLRHAATERGIPTIVYEAGEPMKFQKQLISRGVCGVRNVLIELGMISGRQVRPSAQIMVLEHRWIRAEKGGILIMNVKPGDIIKKGAEIAQNMKPFGTDMDSIRAPFNGLVVGVTTIPMVIPGSAVAHVLRLRGKDRTVFRHVRRLPYDEE